MQWTQLNSTSSWLINHWSLVGSALIWRNVIGYSWVIPRYWAVGNSASLSVARPQKFRTQEFTQRTFKCRCRPKVWLAQCPHNTGKSIVQSTAHRSPRCRSAVDFSIPTNSKCKALTRFVRPTWINSPRIQGVTQAALGDLFTWYWCIQCMRGS